MKIFIIIGVCLLFIFVIIKKKGRKNTSAQEQFIGEIINDFKIAIDKFKSSYMPEVIKLAQINPNPDKKQVIMEMAENGELDTLIKQETMGIYDEVLSLTKSIFALANLNADIDEAQFFKNQQKNTSLTTDLQFEIMSEFRNQNILKYNDIQIKMLIKKLASGIEKKLI